MKIAIINDTHLGIRNSNDIFLDNHNRFYTEIFFPYLVENGITEIIHLGDYFDNRKAVNTKAMNSNRRHFMDHLIKHGIHMRIIAGNHDVYYRNTNYINSLKELFGFYLDNISIVHKAQDFDYDGFTIGLVPWITADNWDYTIDFLENSQAEFLGGHLELSGFEVMRGVVNDKGMSTKYFERFPQVVSGHYHTKNGNGNILYLGAPFQFYWSDANEPKFFHVLDTDSKTLTPVENPFDLFVKIYYDDREELPEIDEAKLKNKFIRVVVTHKKSQKKFDKWLKPLMEMEVHDLKVDETFETFADTDLEIDVDELHDTMGLINKYIDNVVDDDQKGVDIEGVRQLMSNLYSEALIIES